MTHDQAIEIVHGYFVAAVRGEDRNLSLRQLAIFLRVYTEESLQTVRGLAADLKIVRPAVSRALDVLENLDLLRRRADPRDRRSIVLVRTVKGNAMLGTIKERLSNVEQSQVLCFEPEA